MSVFNFAVEEMNANSLGFWGPMSFLSYLEKNGLSTNKKTPDLISVNSLEQLDPVLRKSDCMALRLGNSGAGNTQFCLIRAEQDLESFFLVNDKIFSSTEIKDFILSTDRSHLYTFYLLTSLSETALVNFAFASKLINTALHLDENELSAPATGALSATFTFRPYSKLDVELIHRNGQIQIDALFVARQDRKQKLFILEAKAGGKNKSLAKHKLVYPILAIAQNVPKDMEIVPVYLNVEKTTDALIFSFAECQFPNPREVKAGIDELHIKTTHNFLVSHFHTKSIRF